MATKKKVEAKKTDTFYVGETNEFKLDKDNYYTLEAQRHYCSVHTYLDMFGSIGTKGCEKRALARLRKEYVEETTDALLVGSYIDSYFEGKLEEWKSKHPEIYTKTGILRSPFKQADIMIERVTQDKVFMQYMEGDKQVSMTGEIFGLYWKTRMDNIIKNGNEPVAIVDLKTTGKPLTQTWYSNDYGRVGFVEYWGYDYQLAIYQKVLEINTGKKVPCFIAGITKEDNPDYNIIHIPQQILDNAMNMIKKNADTFKKLLTGELEPVGCGLSTCDYCKSHKVLEKPISYNDIIEYA